MWCHVGNGPSVGAENSRGGGQSFVFREANHRAGYVERQLQLSQSAWLKSSLRCRLAGQGRDFYDLRLPVKHMEVTVQVQGRVIVTQSAVLTFDMLETGSI